MIETQEKPMTAAQIADAFAGGSAASVDHSQRAQRLRRANAAREMLVRKGYTQNSSVFITSTEASDDSDLTDSPSAAPLSMVCEIAGHYAVDLIADRTHRMARPEEIERFREEQKSREAQCAATEARNPNNKQVNQTITYVMSEQAKHQAAQAVAAAEVPARARRTAE